MRHKLDIHPVPEEVLYINELSLAENVPYGFIYSPSVEIYNLTENIYRRFRLWPSADIDFSVWICYTISGLSDIIRCIYESQMVNHQFDIAPSIIF